ncbi:MAG TPA: glycoside hydrolase family 15 protein [Polyangiaceae bacterium]|nr:glycoside hydrolase family 15 protein [Polyangiaceae bacterium]
MRIEDYAIIGDTQTLALVSKAGSIDWLCFPRFDSGACFAALLGTPDNGRWRIAPHVNRERTAVAPKVARRYRQDTLILETTFETEDGAVRLVDFMPPRGQSPDVVRIVEGLSGCVPMQSELIIRFDYGSIVPWVRNLDGRLHAIAGPDALQLDTPIKHCGRGLTTVADFEIRAGDRVPFVLTWHASHQALPESPDPFHALRETEEWWREWVSHCTDSGEYRDAIVRSLITLKALTYGPTGAIVAAGTSSLPEAIGGVRNWDYRYCWLRDSTFTLYALMSGGYEQEACAFRDWLLRAAAGDPSKLQIMYGISGERRLEERTLDWLVGYEESRPVRIGNAAAAQLQLDVYGELSDTLHQSRRAGMTPRDPAWPLQRALTEWLESNWSSADEGLWEVRGPRRQFTHSKVMAWVAFDRAVKAIEQFGLPGPLERWRATRERIHEEVCRQAWNSELRSFTQYYGGRGLDAALLLIPAVGFLPATDARVIGTVQRIERELIENGFVLRYRSDGVDGLPGHEGAFLACSFWLVDALTLLGRRNDAQQLYERLVAVTNDVGLLSEEYDTLNGRLVGNFPQAFSHVALVNSARNLTSTRQPSEERGRT